jgi:molybdopterin/thiamine biosynthesis adenylyltransferase
MTGTADSTPRDCAEFHRLRDLRTGEYISRDWPSLNPILVAVDPAVASSRVAQLCALSLTNMLARVHRCVLFALPDTPVPLVTPSLTAATTFQDALLATARTVDPCGRFELARSGGATTLGLGNGAHRSVNGSKIDWYLGADHSLAYLQRQPAPFAAEESGTVRGAALAACLGASVAFKEQMQLETTPRVVSAWNYREGSEAELGPARADPVSVGRVLMVGAGAVASALVYWLWNWGNESEWTLIDADRVKLHNTNRSLLFLPSDAGWPLGEATPKVDVLARFLPGARPFNAWYDEAPVVQNAPFDVILALANERDVRDQLARRNATVVLHATTGTNWLSQLHRHVAGRDDCIACRVGDVKPVAFACATVRTMTPSNEHTDAALPFLSAASGLMLATLLQRLQGGSLIQEEANNWRWDFLSTHKMAAVGRSRCQQGCSNWASPRARKRMSAGTRWASLDLVATTG